MTENPSAGQPPQRSVNFKFQLPDEEKVGSYANILAVSHTPHEFTLDFAVTGQPWPTDPDDDESPIEVPCDVVARVKIPPTVIFEVLRALNENMTSYEIRHGEIRKPGRGSDQGRPT
jgi:hypothetical protein